MGTPLSTLDTKAFMDGRHFYIQYSSTWYLVLKTLVNILVARENEVAKSRHGEQEETCA